MFVATASLVMMLQVAGAPGGGTVPVAGADEQVCKRIPVTGSLVRKERACKTRAEWKRLSEQGNATTRAIIESGTSRPNQ